ncbi:MAG TPA: hypothetical protein VLJ37_01070 [bacterium]|nr:hypothetical protein [bacterium]
MKDDCPRPLDLVNAFLEGNGKWDGHVRACPSCAGQIRELEADRKAFLIKHPFSSFWEGLEKRREKRPSAFGRFWDQIRSSGALRAAAAMASVAAIMFLVYHRPTPPAPNPEILSKGGVDLGFYVASATGGEAERGKSGMAVPAGTALQFVYSAGDPYLILIGVEADRSLSVYYPSSGTESASVASGSQKKLPQGLRWQPKTGYERFYGVFSKTPVKLEEIQKALEGIAIEKSAKLPLPYAQASVILYRK